MEEFAQSVETIGIPVTNHVNAFECKIFHRNLDLECDFLVLFGEYGEETYGDRPGGPGLR